MSKKLQKSPQILRLFLLGMSMQLCCLSGLRASGDESFKSIEDIYLSLAVSSIELEEVLSEVSMKTGFNFHYKDVDSPGELSINLSEVSLANCLRHISKETGLSFKRVNETIHVDKVTNTQFDVKEISESKQELTIRGTVKSSDGTGLPGVTVLIKNSSKGTVTDIDGNYLITIPSTETVLVYSFVGFLQQEVLVGTQTVVDVVLKDDVTSLDEVVIVGYGEQKKESVIGAVTQTSSRVLQRTAGIPNVATALTGNLPGLITEASTGMPGDENPRIVIRGNNSWNQSSPLVLVDGVERPDFFNSMDVGSVESISVLKDASATAVFGSRGANGVILVTTKRGKEGKAEITANFNTSLKAVSQLPGTRPAKEALELRNRAIEHELATNPASWADIVPTGIIDKYANPANLEERERYPDVDWQDYLFKNYAMAYNANVNVRGGTDVTKYFANLDYQSEDDLFKNIPNGRGYDAGYTFKRLNFRSNLDFQLTPSTKLMTNLGGSYSVRQRPYIGVNEYNFWIGAYGNAPTAMIPRYSDGTWGYHNPNGQAAINSATSLAVAGIRYNTEAQISTNFVLDQKLDFLLKGLNAKITVALDNTFREENRGVNDQFNGFQEKWINPETGQTIYEQNFDGTTRFDFADANNSWRTQGGTLNFDQRRNFYQFQLNYTNTFAEKHNVGLMGLVNRMEFAENNVIPKYREDWVFRTTYSFDGKYLLEYNGAYNGSEQFGPGYKFNYFSSGGIGWLLSEEAFMKSISFLDYFKIRASYGETGDDGYGGPGQQWTNRFLFQDRWSYGNQSKLGVTGWQSSQSPYTWYRQTGLGNPSIRWETVYKTNLAAEFEIFNGLVNGSVDVFRDRRVDIYLGGDGRAVPDYFGVDAPPANLGEVTTEGYEISLGINHTFANGLRFWTDLAVTSAVDKVLFRDDQQLLADYQKDKGYQLGQARAYVGSGFYSNWDDVYASTATNTNDPAKLPGGYHIVDFNADGIIDNLDVIPSAFSGTPQNTYNTNIGFEWKGLSAFVQFYGVNNVTRVVGFNSLGGQQNRAYEEGTYWSPDNTNADAPVPRWLSLVHGSYNANRFHYDGSYLRLKNAEIAYRFDSGFINKIGLSSLRVYLNGNNLLLWTKMPDDRESNFATNLASQGAYPTVRRFNLGMNLTF